MEAMRYYSAILTAATFLLSLIALEIGTHADRYSTWNASMYNEDQEDECKAKAEKFGKECPSLSLEIFFLRSTYIAVCLTSAFIIAKLLKPSAEVSLWSSIYSLGISLPLIIGGILLIVSANQIHSYYEETNNDRDIVITNNFKQYYDEKIAAGVISIISGVLYALSGYLGLNDISADSDYLLQS